MYTKLDEETKEMKWRTNWSEGRWELTHHPGNPNIAENGQERAMQQMLCACKNKEKKLIAKLSIIMW